MEHVYCEYPFMGNPIELTMSKEDALKRYDCKVKALEQKGGLMALSWFVGVQRRENDKRTWLCKNTEEEEK